MSPAGALRSFGAEEVGALGHILKPFLVESGARWAAVLDRDGRLLTGAGDPGAIDPATFATLAAADFEAADQLAALLGEDEFAALYHHGPRGSMYLADVAGSLILATTFDQRATLGLVRMKVREAMPELLEVLDEIAASQSAPAADAGLGNGWADEAGSEIDRLFAE